MAQNSTFLEKLEILSLQLKSVFHIRNKILKLFPTISNNDFDNHFNGRTLAFLHGVFWLTKHTYFLNQALLFRPVGVKTT